MPGFVAFRAGIAGLLLVVAGCGTGTTEVEPVVGPAPATATVILTADRFAPDSTQIAKGGTVSFLNSSGVLHDVDFGTPQLRIDAYDTGERTLSFPTAGRFSYHCNLHAGMEATLVVR